MKRAAALLACALGLAGSVAAQPAPQPAPQLAPMSPRHLMVQPAPAPMTGPGISAPLGFTAGMPTIEVTVNGKGPFRIGFDTGAMGGLHIAAAAAERVGLQPIGEALAADPSGRNPQHIKVYGPTAVGLGGREFPSMTMESPILASGKLAALDGVVGLGLFGGGLVTIDYGRARLTVEPGALPPPDGRTVFAYQGPLPRLTLQVEGRPLEAHLDTGNVRAPVIVPEAFADQLAGRATATTAGVAHTVSSAIPMFAVKLASAPRIGDLPLAVTEAQYPSPAAIGNVGSLALQGLIVRVDTVNRRVQVVAPSPADRAS